MKKYALILLSLLLLLTFSVSDVRAYTITGYRPPSAESRYRIHGSFSNSQYNTVKAAANTWNNAGAKFKFVCESTPDYTPVDFTDNKFHVAFDAFYNYGYPGYANGVFVKKKQSKPLKKMHHRILWIPKTLRSTKLKRQLLFIALK